MDIDTIDPGLDFVEVIQQAVGSCDVLVALIGRHWLTSTDEQGQQRLENPEDFVRLEITAALERNIRVIPALLQGAPMPGPAELPDVLKRLARRNALVVSETRFHADVDQLIQVLERPAGRTTSTPPPPARPAPASPSPTGSAPAPPRPRPHPNSIKHKRTPAAAREQPESAAKHGESARV
jgi:hypothetical protein